MNLEPPNLTVLIPTYQRPKFVRRAIDSVLSQSYNDCVIRVFDNGTDPDTLSLLTKYARDFSNFEFARHAVNVGALGNFRALINSVNTKYFLIMSDDDFLMPHHLRYGVEQLERHTCVLSYISATVTADLTSRTFHVRNQGWVEGVYSPTENTVKNFIEEHFVSTGTIFRRDVTGIFPDFPPLGDDQVSSILLAGNFKHYITPRIGAVWTINESRTFLYSGRRGSRKDLERAREVALTFIASVADIPVKAKLRNFISRFYSRRIRLRELYVFSRSLPLKSKSFSIKSFTLKLRFIVILAIMGFDRAISVMEQFKVRGAVIFSRNVWRASAGGIFFDIPKSADGYLVNARISDRQQFIDCICDVLETLKAQAGSRR